MLKLYNRDDLISESHETYLLKKCKEELDADST